VKKQNPDRTVAVDGLNLHVPDGKTMILVGPSGKTAPLCAISRLVEPTKSRIDLNGRDVRQQDPPSRGGGSAT
jgi:osmoprotectant transport system ATP-binding protein